MPDSDRIETDVAVIGGGIAGLACARELAGTGRQVVLFEEAPGRAASWAAAGMLSPWAEGSDEAETPRSEADPATAPTFTPPTKFEMRAAALALYPEWIAGIQSETGMEIEMGRCGTLVVSLAGERPAAERLAAISSLAPGFRPLTAEQARLESPLLGASVQDAVLLPEEGYADPRSIMPALREACEARSVVIREEGVKDLIEDGGIVRGVRTRDWEVRAASVLNAGGAWASPFMDGARVRPIRGQVASLAPADQGLRPARVIQSAGGYLVPRADGSIVVGATSEDAGFEIGVTDAGIRSLLERAARIAPSLADWKMRWAWSGLRPFREGGPLIGPDTSRPGLFHVVGLFRHGILLAPYAAARIRECIERGRS